VARVAQDLLIYPGGKRGRGDLCLPHTGRALDFPRRREEDGPEATLTITEDE
jgi:hypothetical protein